jgi:hypothetical protein
MSMFIPVSHYAYLMKMAGKQQLSKRYYWDSLRLITPKGLAHYITYLKSTRRMGEADSFIDALQPYAETNPEFRTLGEELKKQFH